MEQQPQWVGIDVSKANLDVYLRPSRRQLQVKNGASGIVELIQQLQFYTIEQVINWLRVCSLGRIRLEASRYVAFNRLKLK
ncbi:MAG: hypothetical protein JO235_01935 [Chroococcidiopsidaceae cyanobacterium CP_BM_RX_35]|nr:hypothetical protein [Chroococcidiopsidaceae cyanobacterium CP_BM_RX_35]